MYSARLINAKLDAFASREGWEPVYHTIGEVLEFKAYIDTITKSDANTKNSYIEVTKKLTEQRQREIRRWIQNEQILCSSDEGYWASRYAHICDEKGDIVQFKNRRSQDVFDSIVARFEDLEVAIELFCLKARQVGISTAVALKFLHRIMFLPNTQAVMASVQADKSELIGRIINICYSHCPWWLVPKQTTERVGKMMGFANGSILSIQSGSQATGIAQGWTPTCLESSSYVRLADGVVVPLSEVRPGMMVLTSKGRYCKVKAAVVSPRQDEMSCELWLWGNYDPLRVTRDHPILTPDGFSEAETLSKHDWVRMPVRRITQKRKHAEIIERPSGYNRTGKGLHQRKQTAYTVPLNRQWGWVVGLYLAEGYPQVKMRHGRRCYLAVSFAIHEKETSEFLSKLQEAFGLSKHIYTYHSKDSKTVKLTINDVGLTEWFVKNFGHGAANKRIPDWVFDGGQEFAEGLIEGYWQGDGHIAEGKRYISCSSISQPLIIQMRDVMASAGFGWCSMYHSPGHSDKGGIFHRPKWELHMHGEWAEVLRRRMGWPIGTTSRRPTGHFRYSPDGRFIDIEIFENRPVFCATFGDLEIDSPEHNFCTIHCCVHNSVFLSEIGDIPNPKKTIEEGLLRATHPSRKLFQVHEGTGNGNTGWQADTWRALKEDFPCGRARFCPVFIPWPLATDLYPEADWLVKFPIPAGWIPVEATRKHVRKAEFYIRSTDYLAEICGTEWTMPRDQQWYWEFNYRAAVKSKTERVWMSQMPADDFEALTGKNDRIFDTEIIEVKERERERNYQAYAITGNTIDEGFDPDPDIIDYDADRIHVEWESNRGQVYNWIMIPLKPFNEADEESSFDKLLVFEPPKEGRDYAIGIDTADGLGKPDDDRAVASVTLSAKGNYPDVQVAEFVSNRINPPQMVGFAACMAAWYGAVARDPRGAKFCIEQRERPGDDCQHQLKLMGFNFHHIMIRYDNKVVNANDGFKQGWYTSAWSRPILLNKFTDALNNGWYVPNSPFLIRELGDFERKVLASGKTKLEHRAGKHDDRIFAAALAYITSHHMDIMMERSSKVYAPRKRGLPEINRGYCDLNQMSIGE